MNTYALLIVVTNTLTLVAGGLITLFAYRAFRRSRIAALKAVAVGFSLLVAGTTLGGVLHLVLADLVAGMAVYSSFTAGGLLVILYSLYTTSSKSLVSPDTG